MHASTLFLTVFLAAFVNAAAVTNPLQSRAGFPTCAVPCLSSVDPGKCDLTDNTCLCKNTAFINAEAACIYDKCPDQADIAAALQVSHDACLASGVTLTSTYTPTSTTGGSSTDSASGTASITSSVSSAASSSTAATSSASPTQTTNAAPRNVASAFGLVSGAAALVAFVL